MSWLKGATTSLERECIFQAPVSTDWKITSKMSSLDSYKPMKEILTTMASASQVLSQGEGCDVCGLHKLAEQLTPQIHAFQAATF